MNIRYLVRRGGELGLAAPAGRPDDGARRSSVVDEEAGSVHTGFAICRLSPGSAVNGHVHSFEECVYVLEGDVVIDTAEGSFALGPGDYGVLPVGAPHALRNLGDADARWAEMTAPQPRARHGYDTFAIPSPAALEAVRVDVRDPRTRSFGHIAPANMDVDRQTQDMLAVSASMRTALLVYSGITVKMMVDTELGAQLSMMFMVQYEARGLAGPHDHPFEETYMILDGAVDAVFDGDRHRLETGDIAWAGVGCVHAFTNPGPGIVRWLETQAPQPPGRHSYRFARDWDYLAASTSDHDRTGGSDG